MAWVTELPAHAHVLMCKLQPARPVHGDVVTTASICSANSRQRRASSGSGSMQSTSPYQSICIQCVGTHTHASSSPEPQGPSG